MALLANELWPSCVDTPEDEEPYVCTTVRWDRLLENSDQNTAASCNRPCPFYLFEHHWTRLQVAKWGTSWYNDSKTPSKYVGPAYLLHVLSNAVNEWHKTNHGQRPEALRIRLRSYPGGRMLTEITVAPRVPLRCLFPNSLNHLEPQPRPIWSVVLDTKPTEPGEMTMFKTSIRSHYMRARAAASITSYADPKEVLLFNAENDIFDASISTPYFYRHGQWITPASDCGGQQGATRRWALENGLAIEGTIHVDSLTIGETIWMSNGIRGYFMATIEARDLSNGEQMNGAEALRPPK